MPTRARTISIVIGVVTAVGLYMRIAQASSTYLNPDEVAIVLSGNLDDPVMVSAAGDKPYLGRLTLYSTALISKSELVVRIVPLVAGTIFPFLVFAWVRRFAGAEAALVSFVILSLSPNLIALSAQARGYTILLALGAATLLALHVALERRSISSLLVSGVCLWASIQTELSSALLAGAAGFSAMPYLRQMPRRWVHVWLLVQIVGIALFAYDVAALPDYDEGTTEGWIAAFLRGAFPAAGENRAVFVALGTLKQFAYAWSSVPVGMIAIGVFAVGLFLLLQRVGRDSRAAAWGYFLLFTTPFVAGAAAALLTLYPYGRSRHTVVLALFAIPPTSVALARLLNSSYRIWTAGALALAVPIWLSVTEFDQNNIGPARNAREAWKAGVQYLTTAVTPRTTILADGETAFMLRFELLGATMVSTERTPSGLSYMDLRRFRVAWRKWDHKTDAIEADLAEAQELARAANEGFVWVADGGFDNNLPDRLRARLAAQPESYRDFGGALTLLRVPVEPLSP